MAVSSGSGTFSGIARALLGFSAAGLLCSAGASCVGLLELEGYDAAAQQLCALLTQCYGPDYYPECAAYSDPRLTTASANERSAWLVTFADSHCLESCLNASACLDMPPVCGGQGEACGQSEQCCGFSIGKGDCSGSCCLPRGVSCTDSAACCTDECEDGFCAGVECSDPGVPCANDYECCTEICNPITNSCHTRTCVDDGTECSYGFECCSKSCALLEGSSTGVCDASECTPTTETCTSPDQCCEGFCVLVDEGTSVCSHAQCLPDAIVCDPEDDGDPCCSGFCDPEFKLCGVETKCLEDTTICGTNSECCSGYCKDQDGVDDVGECSCVPDGRGCRDHYQCCSEKCTSGACEGEVSCFGSGDICTVDDDCCSEVCRGGSCCSATDCSHSVCQPGGPLGLNCDCSAECADANTAAKCAALVCEEGSGFEYCCCSAWDQSCVDRAQEVDVCNAVCGQIPEMTGTPGGS